MPFTQDTRVRVPVWERDEALIAQLGERQTEDLKAPCSIHGQGNTLFVTFIVTATTHTTGERKKGAAYSTFPCVLSN